MEADKILEKFRLFTDGYRMVMLLRRSKKGGYNKDRAALKRTTRNSLEFEQVFKEFYEMQTTTHKEYRIYSCVNSRDITKAIRYFKQLQLNADYYCEKDKNDFYFDIKNRWLSAYMQPQCRKETSFLIDVDTKEQDKINEFETKLVQITRNYIKYETKNGYHYITMPFNPNLLKDYPINKDGLLLLKY